MEKHRCRICSKIFGSGKSLGGHMRSHLSISAKTQVDDDDNPSAIGGGSLPEVRGGSGGGGGSGYELRENPRKTSRFSLDQHKRRYMCGSKECRECGKSFPSWKSLFGHMKCHSAAVKKQTSPLTEESSSSETSLMEGSTESALVLPQRRRRSRRGLAASSSFMSEFNSEVEQLAFNLVLLSRDSRNWRSSAAIPSSAFAAAASCCRETSFARKRSLNYAISKTMTNSKDSEAENYNVKIKKEKLEESHEASTYECSTCKKIFPSFQALGGHRAAHKRNANSRAAAAAASDDCTASTHSTAPVAAGHESLICGKLFNSGPDLVGHKKKSHLVAGDIVGEIVQHKEQLILDLNLPASVEI